ncbi:hypothetical protein POX_a00134 [Penicillium oxalicum]|uniref:Uncharacterized protein n=1 Tax=Penicillium oxalicum (strain 114-2 / CGMCC 5302) TaxID=933388 RepID=S7ZWT6_PENO1|nr:hypothetical protein POX_a00134 [Penicillium oxalicum]EPS34899.1 hypothetical protein PDE_09863 [Penicillium oxalicum 114-2]KAI2793554.1 hypothetical protein POX_a00134 [Penicillium oxalicum]
MATCSSAFEVEEKEREFEENENGSPKP